MAALPGHQTSYKNETRRFLYPLRSPSESILPPLWKKDKHTAAPPCQAHFRCNPSTVRKSKTAVPRCIPDILFSLQNQAFCCLHAVLSFYRNYPIAMVQYPVSFLLYSFPVKIFIHHTAYFLQSIEKNRKSIRVEWIFCFDTDHSINCATT